MARKPMGGEKLESRMEMRISADFEARIEEWRRKQPRIPSKAEAIRFLANIGLDAESKAPADAST